MRSEAFERRERDPLEEREPGSSTSRLGRERIARASPGNHDVKRLPEDVPNVYRLFAGAGYSTFHFGKLHTGCTDAPPPAAYGLTAAKVWNMDGETWPLYETFKRDRWTGKVDVVLPQLLSDVEAAMDSALEADAPFYASVNPRPPGQDTDVLMRLPSNVRVVWAQTQKEEG